VEKLREDVRPLGQLRARHGVFYVTGNHEYYWGAREWMAEMARLGMSVLHNAHELVTLGNDSLVVAGVSDHNGGQFFPDHVPSPRKALSGAPADVPRILLAHQPRTASLVMGERVDLQLSGHTHAGQLFPFNFFVRLQQPVVKGLKRIDGVLTYTHQGTGFWGPPMRLGTFPEIAELTLVRLPTPESGAEVSTSA
jgi:predicted MPP superfamily phosphohydrolase